MAGGAGDYERGGVMAGTARDDRHSGFFWREGDAFLELSWHGDQWRIAYGFVATSTAPRRVVRTSTTGDYQDAVRQIRQVIAYYFAEPEHAERVRVELLTRAGIDPGPSAYLPLPDVTRVTPAGGGAAGAAEADAEQARRGRVLRGEPEPVAPTAPADGVARPWWRRFGGPR